MTPDPLYEFLDDFPTDSFVTVHDVELVAGWLRSKQAELIHALAWHNDIPTAPGRYVIFDRGLDGQGQFRYGTDYLNTWDLPTIQPHPFKWWFGPLPEDPEPAP